MQVCLKQGKVFEGEETTLMRESDSRAWTRAKENRVSRRVGVIVTNRRHFPISVFFSFIASTDVSEFDFQTLVVSDSTAEQFLHPG